MVFHCMCVWVYVEKCVSFEYITSSYASSTDRSDGTLAKFESFFATIIKHHASQRRASQQCAVIVNHGTITATRTVTLAESLTSLQKQKDYALLVKARNMKLIGLAMTLFII